MWFLIHLAPTCYFGDCGELLTAILTHGVPHPTGFPLYLLLTTIVSGFHSGAFGINAVSALSSALSLILFLKIAEKLTGDPFRKPSLELRLGWAVIFLSSATLLLHSSVARVYPLNLTLLLGVLTWSLFFPPRDVRALMGLGFLIGLAASTHTLFLVALPFLVIQFWGFRKNPLKHWIALAFGFVIGVSLYLWIPLLAHRHPTIDWGNPETFGAFLAYLTQKSYHAKMDSRDLEGSLLFLRACGRWIADEWPFYLWFLALPGWIYFFRFRRKTFWAAAGLIYANLLILYAYGSEADLAIGYRYFLPLYFGLALGMAAGLRLLFEKVNAKKFQLSVLILLAAGCFFFQRPRGDLAHSTASYDYALNLLKPLPRGAFLLVQGDNQVFPLAYTVLAKHLRPDIHCIEANGLIFSKAKREWAENPEQRLEG
ncbi:MAG: protein O-mannosyl-transferase family, partial [bacterium]